MVEVFLWTYMPVARMEWVLRSIERMLKERDAQGN